MPACVICQQLSELVARYPQDRSYKLSELTLVRVNAMTMGVTPTREGMQWINDAEVHDDGLVS